MPVLGLSYDQIAGERESSTRKDTLLIHLFRDNSLTGIVGQVCIRWLTSWVQNNNVERVAILTMKSNEFHLFFTILKVLPISGLGASILNIGPF